MNKKLIYRVYMSYDNFDFESAREAMEFAIAAKWHYTPDRPDQDLRVEIHVIEQKCEQESEPEEADALPFE